MQTQIKKFDRRNVKTSIAPEVMLVGTLDTAIEQNPRFLRLNPGFLAVAILLGYNHPQVEETRREFVGKNEGKRIDAAVQYMKQIGISLSPAGKAWGVIVNCSLAIATPQHFDDTQHQIFGDNKQTMPLITPEGQVQFYQAAALTQFQLDDTGQNIRTAAQLMLDDVRNFATPDNNVQAMIIATAIQGKLDTNAYVNVIRALRTEHADVKQAPRAGIEAVQQYDKTNGGRVGQHAQA